MVYSFVDDCSIASCACNSISMVRLTSLAPWAITEAGHQFKKGIEDKTDENSELASPGEKIAKDSELKFNNGYDLMSYFIKGQRWIL